ncbi:early nodulin-like protein 3-like [Hibiscus syriacus]|uniref:Early nodulin-like protein 3-like n=1 Tax=Hibiscus syriacus TaxID=106335 RepID=A0A6A3ADE0_HIBSY|nr:early nodulin-like protein 3-like [Hibiscus syriacus]
MAANLILHAKSKHIELDLHFVREKVAAREVQINYVPTSSPVAYILTKPLPLLKFDLFRTSTIVNKEFSFCDSLYLWEMMWALKYDPDLFYLYEESGSETAKAEGSNRVKPKSTRQCGKYERENMKIKSSDAPLPISVFLVASVLKDKSSKLLHEARGLNEVVKYLNDMTGNLGAKKACIGALKLHKKYLKKAKKT